MNAPTARGLLKRRAAAHRASLDAYVATAVEAIPAIVRDAVPEAAGLVWSRSWDDEYNTARTTTVIAAEMDDYSTRSLPDPVKAEIKSILDILVWNADPDGLSRRNGPRSWRFEPDEGVTWEQGFVV